MNKQLKVIYFGLFFTIITVFGSINVLGEDSPYDLTLGEVTSYSQAQISDVLYERFEIDGHDGIKRVAFKAAFDYTSSNVDMVVWDDYNSSSDYRKATVMEIAEDFEAETGRKVYAAVNGDFFIASYPEEQYIGKTTHTYMKDGEEIVFGWDSGLTNFGFNNQGDYEIYQGILGLNPMKQKILRIHLDDDTYRDFTIDNVDKMCLTGEIGLFMPTYQQIVGNFTGKYIAEVKNSDFDYPIEATIVRDDEQKMLTNQVVDIPSGHIGIAINSFGEMISGEAQYFYNILLNGQKIEILEQERYMNAGFKNLNWVVGGKNRLVIDGEITPYGTSDAVAPNSRHPRTTIGVTADGEFFIQVIDGRQEGYSLGVTTEEQAQLAYDLGAVDAMELDGGGSSTFILRINDELQVVNEPSDGHLRPVANAILFVEDSGIDSSLLPEPIPNCEAYPHLDACQLVDDTEDNEVTTLPNDGTDDLEDNSNYIIYMLSGIGAIMIISSIIVIAKRKR